MATIRIDYTLEAGHTMRVGYRLKNSGNPFVYTSPFPGSNDSPYLITVPVGDYETELTPVCPTCSGSQYGDPVIHPAVIL